MYLNRATIFGYVGNDPEFSVTQNSATQKATFSLASSRRVKKSNGDVEERTQWHTIICWGKIAEITKRSGLAKGKPVYIEGEITYRQWTDNAGIRHDFTEIIGNTIQVFPKFPPKNSQGNAQGDQEGDEDLPF